MSVLPPAARPDPSAAPVACAACGALTTRGAAYSIKLSYVATGGAPGLGAFECPSEQHWCCSPDCAARAAHACIDEHLVPLHFARMVAALAAQAGPRDGHQTDAAPPAPAHPARATPRGPQRTRKSPRKSARTAP